ncbi:MAG: hypothetical protein OXE02_03415 [Chloroflexi bacterium]|nr:hypothetical protein [Chloroflexota bacterium]
MVEFSPFLILGANHDDVTWTIDGKSKGYGFYLTRLDNSDYDDPEDEERYIQVSYDGREWPGEGYGDGTPGYRHTITVTGTDSEGTPHLRRSQFVLSGISPEPPASVSSRSTWRFGPKQPAPRLAPLHNNGVASSV